MVNQLGPGIALQINTALASMCSSILSLCLCELHLGGVLSPLDRATLLGHVHTEPGLSESRIFFGSGTSFYRVHTELCQEKSASTRKRWSGAEWLKRCKDVMEHALNKDRSRDPTSNLPTSLPPEITVTTALKQD